jgi:hypothetical protein
MIARTLKAGIAAAFVAAVLAVPASAQNSTIGVGSNFMGYTFDAGLGADAVQLFMVPVAVRFPITDAISVDLSTAWAQGEIERDNTRFTMSGVTDTHLKLSYSVTPWALLSFGAGIPTGNSTHTGEEAIVASVLATDLLGFREATWGSGFGFTSALATAARVGGWGVGFAGAYSVRGEFEPSTDFDLSYRPGNETRIRVGLDRNIGTNTLTLGTTLRQYESDQADGINLFQAGNRLRFDATYAFRAGSGVWTVYAADVTRETGDLTLSIVDNIGAIVGDTAIATAKQNMLVVGVMGSIQVGGGFAFRPHIDLRLQDRTEPDGTDPGSGWMLAVGGDLPMRLFGGYDFFPKARILYGSIIDATGAGVDVIGAEFSGTVRWIF